MTEETCQILQNFGYQFEQRGLVAVKGKGQLMTYYLLGKAGKTTPPTAPVSPVLGAMETVAEEDESHDSPTSRSDDKTVIECDEIESKLDEDVFLGNDLDGSSSQPLINNNDRNELKETFENTLLLS